MKRVERQQKQDQDVDEEDKKKNNKFLERNKEKNSTNFIDKYMINKSHDINDMI